MALFTDGPPSSMEDLSAQDSQLLTVANTEGIDVTQKLQLAHQEVGLELETLLCRTSPAGHMFWISTQPKVEDVVITPGLQLWHAFRTLEMVYADAYQNQLNDR